MHKTTFGPDYFRNTERFNKENIAAKVDY